MQLAADIAEKIAAAREACRANARDALQEYESGESTRGHDMGDMSRDDKRQLWKDARSGRLGVEWQCFAERRDVQIGVFLWFWEHYDRAPTDEQLARMWPGTEVPKPPGPPSPDRSYVDNRRAGIDQW